MTYWGNKGQDPYKAEDEAAVEIGGQRSIASGAIFGDYDANSEEWRVDSKVTGAKSFSIKWEDVEKIIESDPTKKPLIRVHFTRYNEVVYMIRKDDFVGLREIAKGEG